MSSQGHFTLPVPIVYKIQRPNAAPGLNFTRPQAPHVAAGNVGNPSLYRQSYAPAGLNFPRPDHQAPPANVGNLANTTEMKMYPCRHCNRSFTTAEGMAGHTNVHARTLGKRKAETHHNLPGPYLQTFNPISYPINHSNYVVTHVYPNVAMGVGTNFSNTPRPSLNIPPHHGPYPTQSNNCSAALVPMTATSFQGQQLSNQFKGPAIPNAKRLNGGLVRPSTTFDPPPPITKCLEVRDLLGSFAAKATPSGCSTSSVVMEGEKISSGLDLELKL